MTLKLAIAQLNFVVGDLPGNARKIVAAAREAHAQGARLLLTPELSIAGYAAEDLFLRPAFTEACDDAVKGIAAALADLKDMVVVVGHPSGGSLRGRSVSVQLRHNAASVLKEGRILQTYAKRELPNYQVFDERRYFAPGQGTCVFEAGGVSVGLLICEDAWFDAPAELARAAGAEVLAVINASPYHVGKEGERVARMADRARAVGLPLVYAHLVGGQDEVVFDGASFALQGDGALAVQAPGFEEKLVLAELERAPSQGVRFLSEPIAAPRDAEAQLWDALVLGVRDYVGKNGFPGAILGLSGGIDSALVLAIAVDALGKDKVRAVMMPSPYTADISWIDARDMAGRLGVRYDEISIRHTFESFKTALAPEFAGRPEDTAEENIQARIRGTLLMGLSNKFGSIVLTTGNKSEMATGYCTLYGDMAGGFAVIKDLLKTTVFALARWRNAHDPYGTGTEPIPERIITRPPSAELRPDQTDQDSLPPYDILDAILARYMQDDEGIDEIIAAGYDRAVVERVARLIKINEYKRRQAPVGIRVTHRSFGKDWRYPITSKFNETAGARKP
ncbi:NAD synthetase [Variovorax paradoxus]|jgi:NAD+ synthase (glutamine-hydrolysing)|uniref:NAD+ synthase n=1 Tax=Variovorax paradoxus TaxID=34073 RepID=UPI0006E54E14|nr:NAD synthetase [Variovorax paradoxus]KPV09592.1 NAD synthetase [Variovorax paradoxus]KPV12342.1 NAD synthetase [Variovorax paradoxus]KPV23750.1 NAD synthetase [Variovorax paradoxus]KPV31797.1 NAD synthetase [Variovorax paradoxus]